MTDVSTPVPGSRALVLGGGGVAGIAWEVGVLVALQEAGVDLDAADLVVGTSAGSVVGAFVRNGAVQQAYDQQHTPAPTTYEEPAPIDVEAVQQHIGAALQGATGDQDARARLGQAAQQVVGGQSDDERTATFGETLPSTEWPEKPLAVTAVDATDGTFRLLTAADGVPLPRAVAASCSVPFVWTPVAVDGRPYVDGGVRSGTNADAAVGYERVLVIACGPEGPSPLRAMARRRRRGPSRRRFVGRGRRGGQRRPSRPSAPTRSRSPRRRRRPRPVTPRAPRSPSRSPPSGPKTWRACTHEHPVLRPRPVRRAPPRRRHRHQPRRHPRRADGQCARPGRHRVPPIDLAGARDAGPRHRRAPGPPDTLRQGRGRHRLQPHR